MDILSLNNSDLYLTNNHENVKSERVDYKDKICVKPWGYEFLIYESKKLGTWFLEINKNVGTSTHTHFNKDTIMIVISGKIRLNMIDDYKIYGEGSIIYIPKRKFHGLNSLSDKSYVIEIEIFDENVNFSDKNDLLRLVDNYKRDNTGYANSVQIKTENIEQYNYFYLESKLNYRVENTDICFGELKDIFVKNKNNNIYILYENNVLINDKILNPGSILNYEEIYNLYKCNYNNKFLRLSFNGLINNKIINDTEELIKIISNIKNNNKTITLTCGCFDILHVGHLNLLEESKKLSDILIVLLSSDEQIKFLKGENRPINNENDRINLFKIIPFVDYIIPYKENLQNYNEEILDNYINIIKPDIWTKGSDYKIEDIIKLHPSIKNVKLINLFEGKSTTNIVNSIAKSHNK
jgi:rfaE bifunctional protein nucleotidyltransferase chain/domain